MNHDDLEQRLADHLGGELDERGRADMERAIADDPALAAEIESLQHALADLERLDLATEAKSAAARGRPATSQRGHPARRLLRQAASIILAFVAGFALRAAMPPEKDAATDGIAANSGDTLIGENADEDWSLRTATTYMRHQEKSSLARALIAVTQSGGMQAESERP
ncbi:MAG: anti-sigma factor family protein [Planctomycetota bacterium]|jgi:anti-sigma factor RsiW